MPSIRNSSRAVLRGALFWGALALGFTSGVVPAVAAVNVIFVRPQHYTDIIFHQNSSSASLLMSEINQMMHELGNLYLPPGQDLTVEVLNIQVARYRESWAYVGNLTRTSGFTTPLPSIRLRYKLTVNGLPFIDAEETLVSMNHLYDQTAPFLAGPFFYEKSVLNDWFQSRIVRHEPAL